MWRKGGVQGAKKRRTKERREFLRRPDMTPPHLPLLLLHLNRRQGGKGAEKVSEKKTGVNRTKRFDKVHHPPRLPLRRRGQGGRGVEKESAGWREIFTQG